MATGEISDDETLGGAQMHAERSGLADYLGQRRARTALRLCREVVGPTSTTARLGYGPTPPGRGPGARPPRSCWASCPATSTPLIDVREIIARVVDGSQFSRSSKARYGPTPDLRLGPGSTATRWGHRRQQTAPLFSESSEKAAQFIQLCNQRGHPRSSSSRNITGYMVGRDFEHGGIVKNGSKMINGRLQPPPSPHINRDPGFQLRGRQLRDVGPGLQHPAFTYLWPTAQDRHHGPPSRSPG